MPRPAVIGQSPVFDAGAGKMCIKLYPDRPLRDSDREFGDEGMTVCEAIVNGLRRCVRLGSPSISTFLL